MGGRSGGCGGPRSFDVKLGDRLGHRNGGGAPQARFPPIGEGVRTGKALGNQAGEGSGVWGSAGHASWPAPKPKGLGPDGSRAVAELLAGSGRRGRKRSRVGGERKVVRS